MTKITMVYVVMSVGYDDISGHSTDNLIAVFATWDAAQEYVDIWSSKVNELYIQEEMLRTAPLDN